MNRAVILALLCVMFLSAGCATTGGKNESITQKEINAASLMDFEGNREGTLSVIATRSDLASADQVHLVNSIYKRMETDNSKIRLLNELIKNPAFSNAAKGAILDGLKGGIKVDVNRRQILQRLNDRGPLKDPEPPTAPSSRPWL